FFQAEDGIRDPLVTGVQTCALPIWAEDEVPPRRKQRRPPLDEQAPRLDSRRLVELGTDLRQTARLVDRQACPHQAGPPDQDAREIGRASCREAGEITGEAVTINPTG